MKKVLAWALVLLCLLGCTAETAEPAVDLPENGHTGDADWGLTLSVEDVTPTGLTLVMTQKGGTPPKELIYGLPFWLEVWEDDRWQDVPQVPEASEYAWTDLAYYLPLGDSTRETLNWDWLYGELPPGTYRVCRDFSDDQVSGSRWEQGVYWAVFTLPAE